MDPNTFSAAVVDIVRGFLERELDPVISRIEAFEKRMAELPVPKDGVDADPDAVADIVSNRMAAEIDELRGLIKAIPPAPELPDIPTMISEAIESARPEPIDVKALVDKAVAAIPPAQPGKDADPVEMAAIVAAEVERAVAALPVPRDGESVTIEDVRPLIDEAVTKSVTLIPVPKDGIDAVNLAGALIDRDGNLILTLSDGQTKNLGRVVGTDGTDADMAALERRASELIAALPKPIDGKDGLGWDDLDEELADDGRTIIRRYKRGDEVKEFRHSLAVVLDRGVYKEGQTYSRGDGVTWGGSFWIAQGETTDKPDSGKGWRLAVKRGRDGKDGKDGNPNPPAPKPVKVG